MPILNVRISNPATHSRPTSRFEAIVDSGAPDCYFHSDIGQAIGLKVDRGIRSPIGGIVTGATVDVYYHDISLWVGADMMKIRAGFSEKIAVAAILGRRRGLIALSPARGGEGQGEGGESCSVSPRASLSRYRSFFAGVAT